jgi:hypothetical protein
VSKPDDAVAVIVSPKTIAPAPKLASPGPGSIFASAHELPKTSDTTL